MPARGSRSLDDVRVTAWHEPVVGRAMRWLCRAALRVLDVRVAVRGAWPREPALLLANHLSWLDIVVVLSHVPCTFVAKREVLTWPLFGHLAALLQVVWVDRHRKRDLLRAIPALEQTLRSGRSVLLFAEGTTTNGATLLPFKSALVEAAVRAGCPVVPLALTASAQPPTDALYWIGSETLVASIPRVVALRDAHCTVHIAAPIAPNASRKQLTARARAAIVLRTLGGAIQPNVGTSRVRRLVKQNLRPMDNSEREMVL